MKVIVFIEPSQADVIEKILVAQRWSAACGTSHHHGRRLSGTALPSSPHNVLLRLELRLQHWDFRGSAWEREVP